MAQYLGPALAEFVRLFARCGAQVQIDLQFALIGGLAVSTWGAIRATQHIDFIADYDPSPIEKCKNSRRIYKELASVELCSRMACRGLRQSYPVTSIP